MKRYLFLIALLIAWSGRVVAQSVTVDATIDSLQILIGEQAKIKLQVSLDADKRAIFPVYTDTLVNGVEIIDPRNPMPHMVVFPYAFNMFEDLDIRKSIAYL